MVGVGETPVGGRWLGPLAALGIALAYRLAFNVSLNYDAAWGLVWGRDLFQHGRVPDLSVAFSPTPRPLATLVSGLLTLPGDAVGRQLLLGLSLLAFGALVVVVFRLGEATVGRWPALAGAALIVVSPAVASRAVAAFQDVPFTALILFAALLEVRRPRRGLPVFALLAVAGLLRPQAWLFAGAYWLWLAWGSSWSRRLRDAGLAALGPALWLLADLVVTGDALYSFTQTRAGAAAALRETGLANVPSMAYTNLRGLLTLPGVVAGIAGLALLVVRPHARRRAAVPLAVLALGALDFALLGLAELPLNDRYMLVPAAVTALGAGYALLGWLRPRPATLRPAWRTAWAGGAAALAAALLATGPGELQELRALRTYSLARAEAIGDLDRLGRDAATRRSLSACDVAPAVVHYRQAPYLAYALEVDPAAVVIPTALEGPVDGDSWAGVVPVSDQARLVVIQNNDPANPPGTSPPRGARPLRAGDGWTLMARGCQLRAGDAISVNRRDPATVR